MSRAFVKEDVDLPERSGRKRSVSGLPPCATNYITARGAKHLRDELAKLRAAKTDSERVGESEQILASVHVVDPSDLASNSVAFGATVTVKDKKGRTETYTVRPFLSFTVTVEPKETLFDARSEDRKSTRLNSSN